MTVRPVPTDVADDTGATRERILVAAEKAFVALGFHAATVDGIARDARCSKKTVYKFFASKEELFATLLRGLRTEVEALPVPDGADPEVVLRDFLASMAEILLRDRSLVLMRIAMAEVGRMPTPMSGAGAAEAGNPARLGLERYLAALQREGGHDFGPPHEAARLLIGMALGAFHHELLAGLKAEVPAPELSNRIARAVRIFLRGSRVTEDPCPAGADSVSGAIR
ncbi:TetR/AcrR family transcriptional regulator [Muricoccus radiodurans]|uniref:TetR/AcrR family transcriptional regulator n=1 Tax=Muricoccus radiodurans TaxID=2231721 RepID=UPI003CF07373